MAATYSFRLPEERLTVSLALRVSGEVTKRQFVLLLDLPDDPGVELDDPGLSWSGSFKCQYQYAPVTSSAGVVHAPTFAIPIGARVLRVRVQSRVPDSLTRIEDLALTTELGDRPAIVFAERR